jgi:hypothetical protein
LPPGLPKGTRVQVEFSYAANGRITVTARVAEARQSAQVEFDRQQRRTLDDLDGWLARLRGVDESGDIVVAGDEQGLPVDLADPGSVLRRLDYLFTQVGRAAIDLKLPRSVRCSQQAAQDAQQKLQTLEGKLNQAERERKEARDPTEGMFKTSALARVRTEYEQQKRLADFTLVVLGRDCLDAKSVPDGCEPLRAEVETLRDAT